MITSSIYLNEQLEKHQYEEINVKALVKPILILTLLYIAKGIDLNLSVLNPLAFRQSKYLFESFLCVKYK